MPPLTATERVTAALEFREPDRVPHFDLYWGAFSERWRRNRGLPTDPEREKSDSVDDPEINACYDVDLYVAIADESAWYSQAGLVRREGAYEIRRDGWGRLVRVRPDARFYTELATPFAEKRALDRLVFDSPAADGRYVAFLHNLAQMRGQPSPPFILCKVGGPYLRSSFLRGEANWLMDMVEDPGFVDALAGRVTDHLIAMGLESLRRGQLYETGIAIYDDIAGNRGLTMGPRLYRRFFVPQMARMVTAFRQAGARHIMFHSDGDIRAVLPDLVDIGITALNPVEPRAHMDALALRRQYDGRLALVGGLCNSAIIPSGTDQEVREHVLRVLRAGEGGGLVIGSHTVGPDISQARYDYMMSMIRQYGRYPLRLPA